MPPYPRELLLKIDITVVTTDGKSYKARAHLRAKIMRSMLRVEPGEEKQKLSRGGDHENVRLDAKLGLSNTPKTDQGSTWRRAGFQLLKVERD